ncbi:MAG: hypothetical protein GYA35_03050, partial [Thermoanaerobaculaceae bacterium]|nr:hypothetical protein [Thermoanaerobaculaceae bacterium]
SQQIIFPDEALEGIDSITVTVEIQAGRKNFREKIKLSKGEINQKDKEVDIAIKLKPKKT